MGIILIKGTIMKDPNELKRINLNVPLYLLKEIDALAKNDNKTRTEIFVKGAENEVEERKRKKKLKEFLSRKEPVFNPKDNKEMFELGGTEWVRKLRQEDWER